MFRQIVGQDNAIGLLKNAIQHDRVAQAYLFHGTDGVGKFTSALYFGMALNCLALSNLRPCGLCSSCRKLLSFNHPDFIYIFPTPNMKINSDGEFENEKQFNEYSEYLRNRISSPWRDFYFSGNIGIRKESIAMLQHRLNLSIYEANKRIVIIEHADLMNIQTANAFLKTLEEPPKDTILILITERISALLPTILSRCQQVYFPPLSRTVIEKYLMDKRDTDIMTAKMISMLCAGNMNKAISMTENEISQGRDLAHKIISLSYCETDWEFYQWQSTTFTKSDLKGELICSIIDHVLIYINDLMLFPILPGNIVNIEQTENIERYTAKISGNYDVLPEIVKNIEDLKIKIAGHNNLSLILIRLYFLIKRIFYPIII